MHRQLAGDFCFIATTRMREERKKLGYGMDCRPDYVHCIFESDEENQLCRKWIDGADVVIAGSAPYKLLRRRIREGKPVFRYAERVYKNGPEPAKFLPRFLKWHLEYPAGKPVSLLCASAYTAGDYASFDLFRGRAYRWGYFPECKHYEPAALMDGKKPASILWCGRFLDLKHPDDALYAAKTLKEEGHSFQMDLIGTGEMEDALSGYIRDHGLEEQVRLLGPMKPEQVREKMEKASIFLCTSDFHEGWGAVLNESMNSGCAVVASHAIGAVPFLIDNGKNGLIYENGNRDMLIERIRYLLDHSAEREKVGMNAYRTITEMWNADVAAERFLLLADSAVGEREVPVFAEGPCSPAQIIHNDWFEKGNL